MFHWSPMTKVGDWPSAPTTFPCMSCGNAVWTRGLWSNGLPNQLDAHSRLCQLRKRCATCFNWTKFLRNKSQFHAAASALSNSENHRRVLALWGRYDTFQPSFTFRHFGVIMVPGSASFSAQLGE